jgi:S1-C subfamily serine protease
MRRLLLIFFALSSVAAGGTIEDTIPDSRYLDYGETFAAHTCRITGTESTGRPAAASCVLIAPHWALTAAHVVGDMTSCEIVTAGGRHRVDQIFVHGEWIGEYGLHDIALVHVADPFQCVKYAPLSDGSERLGSVCTATGYGMTGTLTSGLRGGDAALRAGTQRLYGSERSVWVCKIDRRGTPLPLCIAPGDSGGGLWGRAADGSTRLIGINSAVSRYGGGRPRHVAGEESCHTRVSLYLDWIREVAGELDEPCNLAACQPHD